MGKCKLVPATLELVEELSGQYRKQDIDEVAAISGRTPEEAAIYGVKYGAKSWCVVQEDSQVVLVCGVGSVVPGVGVPWLLGSDKILDNKTAILRLSRPVVKEMLSGYDIIENHVDVRNTLSIEWLRWLGFEFDDPKPYGIEKRPFMRFYMLKGGV